MGKNFSPSWQLCLLLLLHWLWGPCVYSDQTLGGKPNANWQCTGCIDVQHASLVFGQIHWALHHEERLAYLAIDMSWLDKLLHNDARVHVTLVDAPLISTHIAKSHIFDVDAAFKPTDEVYEVIVSEHRTFNAQYRSKLEKTQYYLNNSFRDSPAVLDVDEFLIKNPCWVPLSEPTLKKLTGGPAGIDGSSGRENRRRTFPKGVGGDGSGGGRRRRLQTQGNPAESSASRTMRRAARGGPLGGAAFHPNRQPLILIRLPYEPYHPTCKLFMDLTNRQFPPKNLCPYTRLPSDTSGPPVKKVFVHALHNIGFAHTEKHFMFNFIKYTLIDNLNERNIFSAPIAELFLAREIQVPRGSSPGTYKDINGWAWGDPKTCPPEIFQNDPWACNFLRLTNCTSRAAVKSQNIKPVGQHNWETPTEYLRGRPGKPEGSMGISTEFRLRFGDGPLATEEQWAYTRLTAYLQRPNAWLRILIRKSLRAIQPLSKTLGAPASLSSTALSAPIPVVTSSTSSSASSHLQITPCLAMHVRHNDVLIEDRRRDSGVDRSFEAHVFHARNLTSALGIQRIFLATDNATVVEIAASEFPEFQWYSQRRPMSKKSELFLMFTEPIEYKNGNYSTSGLDIIAGGGGAAESMSATAWKSVQKDLANIIADWRFPAQCKAIIGAFDSGFTEVMYRMICSMQPGQGGKCPPSIDLRVAA